MRKKIFFEFFFFAGVKRRKTYAQVVASVIVEDAVETIKKRRMAEQKRLAGNKERNVKCV